MAQRKDSNPDARHGLSADFVAALSDDWKAHGIETIQKVREQQPEKYCTLVAQVVPKELLVASDRTAIENSAPKNSREIAEALLLDVGLSEPSDSDRTRALEAYDTLIASLEQIRDEGLH